MKKMKFLPDTYKGYTYKIGDRVMIVRRFGWKRGYKPVMINPPVEGKVIKSEINIFYPKGPPKLTLKIKPENYDRASPGVVHTSSSEIIVQADEVVKI